MITKLNTAVAAPESKGMGIGGVIVILGLAALAWYGYKHFTKKDEENH